MLSGGELQSKNGKLKTKRFSKSRKRDRFQTAKSSSPIAPLHGLEEAGVRTNVKGLQMVVQPNNGVFPDLVPLVLLSDFFPQQLSSRQQ